MEATAPLAKVTSASETSSTSMARSMRGDERADILPVAEQVEEVVHRVDAKPHGRPAEPRSPSARATARRSRPRRENQRRVATATSGRPSRPRSARRRTCAVERTEAHLENAGGVAAGAFLGGLDARRARPASRTAVFAEHPGASLHGGDAHGRVLRGRVATRTRSGFSLAKHRRVIRVVVRDPVLPGEIADALGVNVEGATRATRPEVALDGRT